MPNEPRSLVQNLLSHSGDRIRYNTFQSTGEIRMATGSTVHFGRYNSHLALTGTPDNLDEDYARVDYNGYQAVIKAAPNNQILLQYRGLPKQSEPRVLRLPPNCAAPLYTKEQLEEAVANHDINELGRGITRAYLTEHQLDQDGITAQGPEVGFSNQALYQALQIHQPQPQNAVYAIPDEQANRPREAAQRIDIPYN